MVPKRFLILAGVALVGLGVVSGARGAQRAQNGKGAGPTYRRVTQPLLPVTLDLATGTIVRGPTVQKSHHTTCVTIDNSNRSGLA